MTKPVRRILRDTPIELQRTFVLPESIASDNLKRISGCGIIVYKDAYGKACVSGLSVRMHPFSFFINSFDESQYNLINHLSGLDDYRLGASTIMVRNMLRLCGYRINKIDSKIIFVNKDNKDWSLLIVKDFEWWEKYERLNSFLDETCIILLKNNRDEYLKIAKIDNIVGYSTEEDCLYLFQNLENNSILPLSTNLVSEIRYKIHMVWDV